MSERPDGMLFGEIAVREGFCATEAISECLEIQQKLRSFGVVPKRVGEILIEKGHLDEGSVDRVLEIQQHRQQTLQIPGYEILELIGKGGMGGQVYKARQVSLDRIVALKVLPPRYAKDRTFRERFISEARAVARLNHENIIAGIDVGEVNGYCYFVMEFVEGETVAEMIERDGALEDKRSLRIVLQIANALAHANKHGLVHRDVKPQNVLVSGQDIAKLCDLGLAKVAETDGVDEGDRRGIPIGTPHYISPEQARGEADVDIRSDIYSLGATLYHMVTGDTPFVGSSPMVLMTKHLTEDPEPPKRRNPKISRATSELVLRMMSKQREDRPQTPDELADELERAIEGKRPPIRGRAVSGSAHKVSGGSHMASSGIAPRQRERPPPGMEAYIDPQAQERRERGRRIRAVRIRGAKRDENVSLIVAIVGILIVIFVILMAGIFRTPNIPVSNQENKQREQDAMNKLKEAAAAKQDGRIEEAKQGFRAVIREHPNTKYAKVAQEQLDRLGGG